MSTIPASNVEHVTFCAVTTAGGDDPSVPGDRHLFAVDGVMPARSAASRVVNAR